MALGTGVVAVVADDDVDIRSLLTMQLVRWGFTVHEAEEGDEALRLVHLHQPHLVLLDVSMPGKDGFEVLRHIRDEQPAVEDGGPAVLLVTARDGGEDVATGLEMGADDYVRKPFHVAELRQRLTRSVENARRFAELESVRRAVSQPRVISVPGMDVAASSEPIGGAGAGGDLMVVTESPGGHVVALLGDAMGHGPAAAARAAYTRTLLSSTARYEPDPGRILTLANSAMSVAPAAEVTSDTKDTEFVTACAVCLHPGTGHLRWASAGHSGPWRVSPERVLAGDAGLDDVLGPPLGLGIEVDYQVHHSFLGQDERLLLHSDALAVTGSTGVDFLADVLPDLLMADPVSTGEELVARVLRGLAAVDEGKHPDDVTVMVLGLAPREDRSADAGAGAAYA